MSLLELMGADVTLKKASTTGGGEYCGPCPWCGGRDRFRVWPTADQYWCRQCHTKGDSIQYLRERRGLSYQEAARLTGKVLSPHPVHQSTQPDPQLTILTYLEEQIDLLCQESSLLLIEKASMAHWPESWDLSDTLDHYIKEAQLMKLHANLHALLSRAFPEDVHVS